MGLDNPLHIVFLLIIALLVFGAKRLPEMGKSLGHGMRGFKDALTGEAEPHGIAAPEARREPVAVVTPGSTGTAPIGNAASAASNLEPVVHDGRESAAA